MIHQPHNRVQTIDTASGQVYTARAIGRRAARSLRCDLGKVLDLSADGMRVETRTVPRGPQRIELYALDKSLQVRGRVAWTRSLGGFRHEVGIAFTSVSRRKARELDALAKRDHGRSFL
jgi:hypothetical protein